jgi:NUMOD4 motif/HNH endonuclease
METWRPIAGWEGMYEVSSLGRVRSLDRTVSHSAFGSCFCKGRILTQAVAHHDYRRVSLRQDSPKKTKNRFVHVLVAEAFIPNPEHKPQVNHKNGKQKWNNVISNLEWATEAENKQHASENGLVAWGERNAGNKVSQAVVRKIRRIYKGRKGPSQWDIGDMFGISQSAVSAILLHKSWSRI